MKKVYFAADIGTNWMGDDAKLSELIARLKDAGLDAVKFQLVRPHELYSDTDLVWRFPMEKYCMDLEDVQHAGAVAKEVGIDWFSSAFNVEDTERLAELKPRFLKVAARIAGDFGILQACARLNLETIVSISSFYRSLDKRGDYYKIFGDRSLYKLVWCVSKYPAEPKDVNIVAFEDYDGFSDHTLSLFLPVLAAARGFLCGKDWFYLEKHVRLDDTPPAATPDGPASITVSEAALIARGLRDLEAVA